MCLGRWTRWKVRTRDPLSQDVFRLNEAREKLEMVICRFCKAYGVKLPRRYRRTTWKNYLDYPGRFRAVQATGVHVWQQGAFC